MNAQTSGSVRRRASRRRKPEASGLAGRRSRCQKTSARNTRDGRRGKSAAWRRQRHVECRNQPFAIGRSFMRKQNIISGQLDRNVYLSVNCPPVYANTYYIPKSPFCNRKATIFSRYPAKKALAKRYTLLTFQEGNKCGNRMMTFSLFQLVILKAIHKGDT